MKDRQHKLALGAFGFVLALGLVTAIPSAAVAQAQKQQPVLNEDADVQELMQQQQKMQKQMSELNAMNPLSAGTTPGANGGMDLESVINDIDKIDPRTLPPNMRWAASVLKNPTVAAIAKRLMKTVLSPDFQKSCRDLAASPHRVYYLPAILVYYFLYWLFKRRVLAATDRFFVRGMLRLSLAFVFCGGQFLVSYLVLGQPFFKVMVALGNIV